MAIAFACASCGKQYRVADDMAGRKGKCSKCGAGFRIPAPKKKKVPVAKPVAGAEDSMFSFETQPGEGLIEEYTRSGEHAASPGPRRKGGFPFFRVVVCPLFILMLTAALAAVGAIAYGVPAAVKLADKLHLHPELIQKWLMQPSGIEEDLPYLPSDCQAVAMVNVENFLKSEAYSKAEDEADKEGLPVAEWEKFGPELTLRDIRRITVGVGKGDDPPAVAVIRFNKPVSPDDFQKALEDSPTLLSALNHLEARVQGREQPDKVEKVNFEKETEGKYTLYSGDGFAFCVVGDRAFAFGRPDDLKANLNRKKRNRLPKLLQEALAKANPTESTFAWAMLRSDIPDKYRDDLKEAFGDRFDKVEAMAVSLHVEHEIALNTSLFCKDAKTAEEIQKEAEEKLGAINTILSSLKDAPKDPLKPSAVAADRRVTVTVITDVDKVMQGKEVVSRLLGKSEKGKE